MEKIVVDNNSYVLEKNDEEAFNLDEFRHLYTEYFYDFDYILGDYAYDKLRLKGFCVKGSPRYSEINDIKGLDKYIEDYCSYKAKCFLLKKVK